MQIIYKFANGENSTVEVSEKIGEIILSSRRKEHADNERQRYYTGAYLDSGKYLCDELADDSCLEEKAIEYIEGNQKNKQFWEMFNRLTPVQQRRVRMRAAGMTFDEIAEIEGRNKRAIAESIHLAKKKFEKIF